MTEETLQPIETQPDNLAAPTIPQSRYFITIGIIVLVLLLDQIFKIWIKTNFYLGEERPLIGDWALLHFTENNGIAFGLELPGEWGKLLLTTFRIIAACFIFVYLMKLIRKGIHKGIIYSGAFIFAGAVGNIIDSIFYGVWFREINSYEGGFFHGRVVDMLYFPILKGRYPEWMPFIGGDYFEFFRPVFNLADSSITIGILLIILFFRKYLKSL